MMHCVWDEISVQFLFSCWTFGRTIPLMWFIVPIELVFFNFFNSFIM